MSMNGPIRTPYDNPLVGTPGVGEATTRGAGVTLNEGGGQGLTGTPYEAPLMATPGQGATGNTSGIPNVGTTVGDIPDAPAPGSPAAVADGVATPMTPAANITGGHPL